MLPPPLPVTPSRHKARNKRASDKILIRRPNVMIGWQNLPSGSAASRASRGDDPGAAPRVDDRQSAAGPPSESDACLSACGI